MSCFSDLLQVQPREGKMSHCIQGVHNLIEKISVLYLLFTVVVRLHCMAQTIKTNVMGTLNMLGLAKRVGARFESSLYLYDVIIATIIAYHGMILGTGFC